MIFRQLLDPDLGCACYVLGDAGRGAVVDPGLDVDAVLACAAAEGLRIEVILETHVHADHVSGRAQLAEATGAAVHLPAGGGQAEGAGLPLADGDVIELGDVRITALAAPGHRPEHLALAVADLGRGPAPWLLLTGDSLLVGDLARPDLAIDARDGAAALHATVARLVALGDGVEVWPGHVGGSLCGGPGLSRKSSSTVGYERAANPLLAAGAEELTERLLASLPSRPPTVEHVVARNRATVPAPVAALPRLDADELAATAAGDAVLVDVRPARAFDAAHLAGSLSLALTGSGLGTRTAWVLDPEDTIVVLGAEAGDAGELARRLRAVGLDVAGLAVGEPAALAADAGMALTSAPAIELAALPALVDEVVVVDVRDGDEWRSGHYPDAVHLPLPRLREGAAALPDAPLAVMCARGPRAAFAASWLRARGHDARRVADGGAPDLPRLGLAVAAA